MRVKIKDQGDKVKTYGMVWKNAHMKFPPLLVQK